MLAESSLLHLTGLLHGEALEGRYWTARVHYDDGGPGVAHYSCEREMLYVSQLPIPYGMVLGLRDQFHSCDYVWGARMGDSEVHEE